VEYLLYGISLADHPNVKIFLRILNGMRMKFSEHLHPVIFGMKILPCKSRVYLCRNESNLNLHAFSIMADHEPQESIRCEVDWKEGNVLPFL
jgi:hypothetical protein